MVGGPLPTSARPWLIARSCRWTGPSWTGPNSLTRKLLRPGRADLADGHFATAAASLAAIEKPAINVPVPTAAPSWAGPGIPGDGAADCLEGKEVDEAIAGFEKAIELDRDRAKDLDPRLALARAERGFESCRPPPVPPEAVVDLRGPPPRPAPRQIWQLAGLTSAMPRDSYDRGKPRRRQAAMVGRDRPTSRAI